MNRPRLFTHATLWSLLLGSASTSWAQDGFTVDNDPPQRAADSAALMLSQVKPAIVSVFPARILEEENLSSQEARERFFKRGAPAEEDKSAGEEQEAGVGSGVIISPDGLIITNAHVVELGNGALADAVKVELADKRRLSARILGSDSASDIALLQIDAQDLPFLTFANSDHLLVGDPVWAVGNPFKIGITATAGMISALNRTGLGITGPGGYEAFIQTDAPINPGNSGGALVDQEGRLIGINTAIWGGLRANVGIGFAVPSNFVRHIGGRLQDDGKVVRGFMGLRVEEVDESAAIEAGMERILGTRVEEVLAGGPAAEAGLLEGDIILKVAGTEVSDAGYFRLLASLPKPGEKLLLAGKRGKLAKEWTLTLGDPSQAIPVAEQEFEVKTLPGVRLKVVAEGLQVISIAEDAAATIQSRLKEKMILIEANGEPLNSLQDSAAIRSGVNKLKVLQDGRTVILSLKLN